MQELYPYEFYGIYTIHQQGFVSVKAVKGVM